MPTLSKNVFDAMYDSCYEAAAAADICGDQVHEQAVRCSTSGADSEMDVHQTGLNYTCEVQGPVPRPFGRTTRRYSMVTDTCT